MPDDRAPSIDVRSCRSWGSKIGPVAETKMPKMKNRSEVDVLREKAARLQSGVQRYKDEAKSELEAAQRAFDEAKARFEQVDQDEGLKLRMAQAEHYLESATRIEEINEQLSKLKPDEDTDYDFDEGEEPEEEVEQPRRAVRRQTGRRRAAKVTPARKSSATARKTTTAAKRVGRPAGSHNRNPEERAVLAMRRNSNRFGDGQELRDACLEIVRNAKSGMKQADVMDHLKQAGHDVAAKGFNDMLHHTLKELAREQPPVISRHVDPHSLTPTYGPPDLKAAAA